MWQKVEKKTVFIAIIFFFHGFDCKMIFQYCNLDNLFFQLPNWLH